MRIVIATGNAHKVGEIAAILGDLPAELVPMSVYGLPEPVEDGQTFEDNALIKARAGAAATGLPAIADDSGIAVDALDGAPGVHSARFAGEAADDAANNARLLRELASHPRPWRARFVCAAAVVTPDGRERVVIGEMPGQVIDTPRGHHGFGYDPLFVADEIGDGRTNAEIAPSEKDAISHRGRAFAALRSVVLELVELG